MTGLIGDAITVSSDARAPANPAARALVRETSLHVARGECVALLGPNGAGKTTLLRALVGLAALDNGAATLDGRPVNTLASTERARGLSYLPQERTLAWPALVRDIVALGRFAYGAPLGALAGDDEKAVARALADCGLAAFATRRADTLSGGEQALMHCARVFASEADFVCVDEPAAALDPAHQQRVMALLKAYARKNRGVLIVLHDIMLAAQYADRILWMKDGRIIGSGPPSTAITEDMIKNVYGVNATIIRREDAPPGVIIENIG